MQRDRNIAVNEISRTQFVAETMTRLFVIRLHARLCTRRQTETWNIEITSAKVPKSVLTMLRRNAACAILLYF